jgi:hypothetical protein
LIVTISHRSSGLPGNHCLFLLYQQIYGDAGIMSIDAERQRAVTRVSADLARQRFYN